MESDLRDGSTPFSGTKILYRRVEQLVARRAHNPEVRGSIPLPASKKKRHPIGCLFLFVCGVGLHCLFLGYEADERSSLGEEPKTIEYRFWRTKSLKQGARRARPVLRRRATMRRDGDMFALASGTATQGCVCIYFPCRAAPTAHPLPLSLRDVPLAIPRGGHHCCGMITKRERRGSVCLPLKPFFAQGTGNEPRATHFGADFSRFSRKICPFFVFEFVK